MQSRGLGSQTGGSGVAGGRKSDPLPEEGLGGQPLEAVGQGLGPQGGLVGGGRVTGPPHLVVLSLPPSTACLFGHSSHCPGRTSEGSSSAHVLVNTVFLAKSRIHEDPATF